MPHRLAIVLTHATQYYSPWFRWLQANTSRDQLTFRVFYLSDSGQRPTHDEKFQKSFAWDTDLLSGYDHENVPNSSRRPDTLRYSGIQNPTLRACLRAFGPTAILLFGYNYHTHLRLILWARFSGIPLIFRGDSHLIGRPPLGTVKHLALSALYAQFAAVTYVGQANRDYFRHLGVPAARLHFAPHSVNADLFTAPATVHAKLDLSSCRHVVLFAGKFIPQKQPQLLLSAYLSLPASVAQSTALLFVGDGPLKAELKSLASLRPELPIHFFPFANQSEMPALYALADIVVLPSIGAYETWGLVVNEAMHLGRPCLVSQHVGCQRDLVTHGQTGWVFDPDSPVALMQTLAAAIAQLTPDRHALRSAVLNRISNYTYAQTTAGLLAALASLPKN